MVSGGSDGTGSAVGAGGDVWEGGGSVTAGVSMGWDGGAAPRPGEGQGTLWETWGGQEPAWIHRCARNLGFSRFPGLSAFPGWYPEG